ncbi:cell division ATP-binding protein FtsE [Terrisporobacter sp.]|uniref:cell division ATP-binding protein FtsE n=1 Tax=Terrisporobacter sp. TaxID=1965305 RepID=UPI00260B5EC9|nr:cell division ATP-binding protein FtsE [Terrisporobacter sp.]
MIKFTKVEKQYSDGNMCLKDINLRIDNGEFVFLLGHSGAGKSTLLKLISREEKLTDGKIIVNKENITNIKDRKIHNYRRKLGIVFQDYKLLQEKTVYENVELALRVVGEDPKNIKQKVMDVLEKVGIADKYNKYPDELSGGECQRVGIARAIVNKPSIIIADECTGNLDMDNSISIMKLLSDINKEGITVIMATHNLELVKEFPRRIVKIEDGKIIYDTKRYA